MKSAWWLEISPLKEGNYTGISQVTAALAQCMLGDGERTVNFCFGRAVVPPEVVADMVRRRNGELIEWYLARSRPGPAPNDPGAFNIAIFPNRKHCRGGFDFEAQIVHDLSTLLTPQFHGRDTIDYHALSLLEDIRGNDLTLCVSEATRADVLRYLGPLDPARVIALRLAAHFDGLQQGRLAGRTAEPYVLVLGTIEPRKNIAGVLAFLRDQPHLLHHLRFVFLGRHGWGESVAELMERHELGAAYAAGRIVFPGFVSEATKLLLLERARMLIYPSVFEGFGLPVLEALTLGVPCLTTRSSSIPEAGGRFCTYFDPFMEGDFARGFALALQSAAADPHGSQAARDWAAGFSWAATYRAIIASVEAAIDAR